MMKLCTEGQGVDKDRKDFSRQTTAAYTKSLHNATFGSGKNSCYPICVFSKYFAGRGFPSFMLYVLSKDFDCFKTSC